MNITFFIGNGFDIGVGLPSRFTDYFPIYYAESRNKEKTLKQLSEHIQDNQKDWSYFERQLGSYAIKFNIDNKHIMLEQLKDFQKGFIDYLRKQEQQLSFYDENLISSVMQNGLAQFYSADNLPPASSRRIARKCSSRATEKYTYNFISFNYTRILETCLNTIKDGRISKELTNNVGSRHEIGKIVHAHGYWDACPIMGVNDSSQILKSELANDIRFAQYLIKPILNKVNRTNYDEDAVAIIDSSDIICIYGMSLGETDTIWWNRVIEWLCGNGTRQLVVFLYDADFSASTQFDRIGKEDWVIDTLTEYKFRKEIDVELLRPRIHVAIHRNIFEMDLRNDETKAYDKMIQKVTEGDTSALPTQDGLEVEEYMEILREHNLV